MHLCWALWKCPIVFRIILQSLLFSLRCMWHNPFYFEMSSPTLSHLLHLNHLCLLLVFKLNTRFPSLGYVYLMFFCLDQSLLLLMSPNINLLESTSLTMTLKGNPSPHPCHIPFQMFSVPRPQWSYKLHSSTKSGFLIHCGIYIALYNFRHLDGVQQTFLKRGMDK